MKPRTLLKLLAGCVALAAMADSCAPTITIVNQTPFVVRAVVWNKGVRQVVSPSPNESSYVEAQTDVYTVTVIGDDEWLDHARATREYLNEQLKNADQMTGPQILEVVRRLKEIAAKIKAFEDSAKLQGQTCGGQLTDDKTTAQATVSLLQDGSLSVVCR